MANEWACGEVSWQVERAVLEVHRLDDAEVAWHLSATGVGDQLLISGVAIPLAAAVEANLLTPTFIDAPNPLLLEGERGAVRVNAGRLWLRHRTHVSGRVECAWRGASSGRERTCELRVELDVELRFM